MNKIVRWSNTQGTEPSKYLEEKKSIEIPLVVANERGRAQTACSNVCGVVGQLAKGNGLLSGTTLGRSAKEGESPVCESLLCT